MRESCLLKGSFCTYREFSFELFEMMYVLRGSFEFEFDFVLFSMFCLMFLYNLSHKLDDIVKLMIFFGYLVLVWICDTKLSLYYISTHAFIVCFQCFRNLQVNSFMMLLSIVATCR